MSERLTAAEHNIEKIQTSVASLQVEQARQGEQIHSIKDVLVSINRNMEKISDRLDRSDDRIGTIEQTMHDISRTLAVNTQSLQDHMRRTENLENRVVPLERGHWKATGMFTLASIAGGLIVSFAAKLLG